MNVKKLLGVAMRQSKYRDFVDYQTSPCDVEENIVGEFGTHSLLCRVGSFGNSSSVDSFMYWTLRRMLDEYDTIDQLVILTIPTDLGENKCDIYALAIGAMTTYICGGMTNYSGEGGAAYESVRQFCRACQDYLGIPYRHEQMDPALFVELFDHSIGRTITREDLPEQWQWMLPKELVKEA